MTSLQACWYRYLNLTKDQTLDQCNRYPEAKDLTDKQLDEHALKLHGRGCSTYCSFRQWSPDAKFIDEVSYIYSQVVWFRTVPNGFKRVINGIQYYKKA